VLKAPQRDQAPLVISAPVFPSFDREPLVPDEGEVEETELFREEEPPIEESPDPEPPPPPEAPAEVEEPAGPSPEEEAAAIRAEAEHMLAEARSQVAEFLREAQQQAQAMEAEARERGFREGMEAAQEAQRRLLADLEALRAAVQAERELFFENLEPEVVRLALAIAEKMIRQEVDLHPEIVVGVARAALLQLKDAQTARVSAHPASVDALRQHLASSLPGGPSEISIHATPLVSPGGCVVDSDRGSVDARLETQMERITTALQEGDTG
jgi:flagellar assembly protein FliH